MKDRRLLCIVAIVMMLLLIVGACATSTGVESIQNLSVTYENGHADVFSYDIRVYKEPPETKITIVYRYNLDGVVEEVWGEQVQSEHNKTGTFKYEEKGGCGCDSERNGTVYPYAFSLNVPQGGELIYTKVSYGGKMAEKSYETAEEETPEETRAPVLYNVYFYSCKGSKVENIEGLESGDKVQKPASPTKEGYKFGGWCTDYACTMPWDFDNDTVTDDHVSLYAKWDVETYAITYELNGGTNHEDNPAEYTIESGEIVLQDPTRKGYRFVEWTPSDTIPAGSTEDMTFAAKWKKRVAVVSTPAPTAVPTTAPTPAPLPTPVPTDAPMPTQTLTPVPTPDIVPHFSSAPNFFQLDASGIQMEIDNVLTDIPCQVYYLISDQSALTAAQVQSQANGYFMSDGNNIATHVVDITGVYDIDDTVYLYLTLKNGNMWGDTFLGLASHTIW